jgi:hypothetical protein
MPLGAVADEINGGMRGRIDADPRGIDTLVPPQGEKLAAEFVVAQPRQVGDARALARGGHRAVHRIPAESLQVLAPATGELAELVHRFPEGNDIELHAASAAVSRNALACRTTCARSPAASALRSITLLPTPTTQAPALK